jgi:hypothetical protein
MAALATAIRSASLSAQYIHDCIACRFIYHIDRCIDRSASVYAMARWFFLDATRKDAMTSRRCRASPCCSLGSRLVLRRKLLIFGCHFEIAFPQIFRADLSYPTTFLCPFGIGLPLQSLHVPMKCFRHWAAPPSYVWHLTDNGADEAVPVAVFNFLWDELPEQLSGESEESPEQEPKQKRNSGRKVKCSKDAADGINGYVAGPIGVHARSFQSLSFSRSDPFG